MTATPAAPTPVMTTLISSIRLPTTRRAFSRAARTTIAVPCWSSWKTGMSSSARRRSSISKQRGAEMSSRLMPPKPGAIALTAATISSVSFVSRQIGQASTPPNSLKSSALPSITGIAASGPMSPRPRTAVPSDTTATVFCLIVRFQAESRSSCDREADAGDTRGVRHREVVARLDRDLRLHLDLPAEVHEERAVGDALDLDAVDLADALDDPLEVVGVRGVDRDVADLHPALDPDEVDGPEGSSRLADRAREPPESARAVGDAHADRGTERGRYVTHVRITPSAASAAISSVVVAGLAQHRFGVLADRRRRGPVLRPVAVERQRQRRQPEALDRRMVERLQHPESLGLW